MRLQGRLLWSVALVVAMCMAGCGRDDSNTSGTSSGGAGAGGAAAPPSGSAAARMGEMQQKATTQAAGAMQALEAKANGLLTQAQDYIKQNKLDLASKAVAELETLKSQLPVEWQARIDKVRAALDQAKAAMGNLPGGTAPVMPNP